MPLARPYLSRPMSPPPDTRARSARTRSALLDAAEELFAARGFADVGSRELAARAGVNVAQIAYHFGSKRGLYVATCLRSCSSPEHQAVWDRLAGPHRSPAAAAAAFVAFVQGLCAKLLDPPDLEPTTRLMLREALAPSEALMEIARETAGPHEDRLAQTLTEIAPGASPEDARLTARAVFGEVLFHSLFRPFFHARLEAQEGQAPPGSGPASSEKVAEHVARRALLGLGRTPAFTRRALERGAAEAARRRS